MPVRNNPGKNTACNFFIGTVLMRVEVPSVDTPGKVAKLCHSFRQSPDGKLHLGDVCGDTKQAGELDIMNLPNEAISFAEQHIYPNVKLYSFADLLKQAVCISIMGLSYEQCYGTDEQKNSITQYKWEDMPGVITPDDIKYMEHDNKVLAEYNIKDLRLLYHEPGYMTAREVMQFVGTGVFRKMYSNIWADACIRHIKADSSAHAIICDCRFPNEVEAIQRVGGKVIKLTRDVFQGEDQHASEVALDKENYDWNNFDAIIDNQDMSIEYQNKALIEILSEWEW